MSGRGKLFPAEAGGAEEGHGNGPSGRGNQRGRGGKAGHDQPGRSGRPVSAGMEGIGGQAVFGPLLFPLICPLGRPATPEEAAAGILMLASPLADYITGQIIRVTGGMQDMARPHQKARLRRCAFGFFAPAYHQYAYARSLVMLLASGAFERPPGGSTGQVFGKVGLKDIPTEYRSNLIP